MLDYKKVGKVAVLGLDDGKANAVGHAFVDALDEGLNRAREEASSVLIRGRPGVLSAGFDLKEFEKGPQATQELVARGAQMLLRVFTHPQPVVAACGGHAVAAGALLLLASDVRIGAAGDFKLGLNETAIGMTLPVFGIQLAAARLSKRYQTRAVVAGDLFGPEDARDAGFLDEVVEAEVLFDAALTRATELAELPGESFSGNKLAIRQPYVETIRASLA